jgi:phage major head subunit gpT-like protein
VLDTNGVAQSVANTDGGSGTPWFLIDASRVLKPIILQKRKDFQFTAKDSADDDNVFFKREFLYGVDARMNVGFGFWQSAWGSRQPLNPTNYSTARAALASMKGDYGRPLGLKGTLLVVPPSLESQARQIVRNDLTTGGATNEWAGSAELFMSPWLA